NDSADSRRRALIRLNERRMVVRLNFENRRQAIADVHSPCVFSRSLEDLRALRGESLQVHARTLVAAVLGPHHGEDAELRQVGLAPEELHNSIVLLGFEAVSFDRGGIDAHAVANAFTMDSRITRPSTQPSAGSAARSGWGIMPTTFRR